MEEDETELSVIPWGGDKDWADSTDGRLTLFSRPEIPMDEQWVEVRNCNWLHEAYFVKSVLEGDGLEVLIPDEHILGAQPLYANAVGGARVLVRLADLQRAAEILDSVMELSGDSERLIDDDAV